MDSARFDHLSRLAAGGHRRRAILAALAAAATGAGATQLSVAAACKKTGRSCDRNSDCCDNATCRSKKCRCRSGFESCDGRCNRLSNDVRHCGACGFACDAGQTCCDGVCVGNLDQNNEHCGACGNSCGAFFDCVAGVCVFPGGGCPAGASSCDVTGPVSCGQVANCRCQQTTAGATVCVNGGEPPDSCGQCDDDGDCAFISIDAVCVRAAGNGCCAPGIRNFCALPCPTPN